MANKESRKIKCLGTCEKELTLGNSNFFKSNNPEFAKYDGFSPICKSCSRAMIYNKDNTINLNDFKKVLKYLNKPFIRAIFDELLVSGFTLGDYTSRLNFGAYRSMTYEDSDNLEQEVIDEPLIDNTKSKMSSVQPTSEDKKNEQDVIKILGYDPFFTDSEDDRRLMFNSLIDFLDEETQQDNFKCLTVIEIVKLFSQAEKINYAINVIMKDHKSIKDNPGTIKALMDTKKGLLQSALALAKDNGISVNHNNNKSKGGNTLNGIVKKLEEIGLQEAKLNLFSLETCEAMKQIADISHKSILDQLVLDENDYTEMIATQKDMIKKADEKIVRLEEENRLLKIQLKQYENLAKEVE